MDWQRVLPRLALGMLMFLAMGWPARTVQAQAPDLREIKILACGFFNDTGAFSPQKTNYFAQKMAERCAPAGWKPRLIGPKNEHDFAVSLNRYVSGDNLAAYGKEAMPSFATMLEKSAPDIVLFQVNFIHQTPGEIQEALQEVAREITAAHSPAKIILMMQPPYGSDDWQVMQDLTSKDLNLLLQKNRQAVSQAIQALASEPVSVQLVDVAGHLKSDIARFYEKPEHIFISLEGVELVADTVADQMMSALIRR